MPMSSKSKARARSLSRSARVEPMGHRAHYSGTPPKLAKPQRLCGQSLNRRQSFLNKRRWMPVHKADCPFFQRQAFFFLSGTSGAVRKGLSLSQGQRRSFSRVTGKDAKFGLRAAAEETSKKVGFGMKYLF